MASIAGVNCSRDSKARGALVAWLLTAWMSLLVARAGSSPQFADLERELAANPTNRTALVQLAKAHHNEATRGGEDAAVHITKARDYLGRLLSLDPKHAFGRALLGSTTILTAREAFWPGTKMKRVREGLAVLDAALADSPDDPDARFTRAVNNLFLPDLFDRRKVVEADFQWLQERADRGEFAPEFRQYVFLYHGRARAKWRVPGRAKELWENGLAIDPKSKVADELRRELAGLKPEPATP